MKEMKNYKENREKKHRNNSIKTKLLIGIVGLSVTISILFGVVTGVILYSNTEDVITSRVNESVTAYNQAVQNAIANYKTKAEAIAENTDITSQTLPLEQRKAIMEKLAKQYGFVEVMVADSTGRTSNNTDASDRDYFKKAMAGETYVSSTLVRKTDSSTALMVSAKAANYDGIVVCVLSSDTFSKMIDDVSIGQSGYGFIVDKDGTIIAHKERSNVTDFVNYIEKAKEDSTYADIASVVQEMVAGKSGLQAVSLNGTRQRIGYTSIPDTENWSIAVSANEKEMKLSFYRSMMITVLLTVLFVILSFVIAFKVANPIVKPIIALVKRIEKLSDGDLHSEVPLVETGDEIETLSQSFAGTVDTLSGYVGEISSVLGSLAEKDCTADTQQDYRGDFAPIGTALRSIIAGLNETFERITQSAEQVASGAEQVSNTSQALSQGATEQASSIEELSASITEIAQNVNKNAGNAATANQLSLEVTSEVAHSNEQMEQMVMAMSKISESSNEIGKIIKTIEDIAFQTNILALNAAVEAARAGEAGKGFAVVADEVRNLASKSAQAAKSTTSLIAESIRSVENGKEIADKTAESIHAVIESVKKTTALIGEISAASNEQATSINQVTLGVDQISGVVQTNSATSEESAATSEELSNQAKLLKDLMAEIKLKSDIRSSSVPKDVNTIPVSAANQAAPSKY